ncbi:MAG: ribonuclease HI [Chloroflexi bacterium]|nr:ribonuclease HI [Chloroflexota bacterium]
MTQFKIWTDGACSGNPGVGAWAAIICDENDQIITELGQTEDRTTNNLMELRAALMALKFVDDVADVVIRTDSNLVVGWMLGTYDRKNHGCRAIADEIDRLIQHKNLSVEWVHVGGHSGDAMNERADKNAKRLIQARKRELQFPGTPR